MLTSIKVNIDYISVVKWSIFKSIFTCVFCFHGFRNVVYRFAALRSQKMVLDALEMMSKTAVSQYLGAQNQTSRASGALKHWSFSPVP